MIPVMFLQPSRIVVRVSSAAQGIAEADRARPVMARLRGDNAVFNPATDWSVGYDQIMHEEVQAALLGQKSAEQALGDAQARLMDMASLQ
jgi:ABC-type glycerol-3-phosphate transport system substrate-binding protein